MANPFEVLPAEVYLHIASFVDLRDVQSLARMNRVWHSVVEQDAFWRGLYVRRFVDRQGVDLPPPFARQAAWPVGRRPVARKSAGGGGAAGETGESDGDGDEDDFAAGGGLFGSGATSRTRLRQKELAQALMKADTVEREADERRMEEEEMARIRRLVSADTPHAWRTCYRRRLRMKEGVCLVFMVGSNSLPYAADVVDKLYTYGIKVNSTCIIQQPYGEGGPHEGWEEELVDHMKHHSVLLFFANIAGGSESVRATIGNHMADFVEDGGSVVLLAFATCNVTESPGGRWQSSNYFPIGLEGQTSIHVALDLHSEGSDHHLLTGVRRAFVSYHGVGSAHPQAKVLGRWSDKTPAMARLKAKKGTVVAVNFFPPSTDIGDGGWPADGHGWISQEDKSSARAWMYHFLDRLNVRHPGVEGEEMADDVMPEETLVAANAAASEMEIPPELTQLLRSVSLESASSGDDPWEALITRIHSDDETTSLSSSSESQLQVQGLVERTSGDDMVVEAAEGSQTAETSSTTKEEDCTNDAMIMLVNAVRYGLWKASRLEQRKQDPQKPVHPLASGLPSPHAC